ncbi:phosphoribosylformylglycinamidine synthase [Caldicellulosiruptor bescii]|uniref:Phosphoribosylformylglycinamidine synthase subunit PurL n=2 Tax=Caldicellulosiruptor bescii TaxID=31899 RepID=B9MS93_CALBD|nr:phosphoribosylformylglycinamidine synthase subunit PurL [Caldicellulosiruptor bescii]ACM60547.1 phosphoribosylformylglycinamidine synthase II [Caldicellulosiruptor bescii DSM 6725]PBC87958.1 phosphoribosylformylglycinamidine synthase [Caldicellulosiruptor bescii]PBC90890.1 phosphoribosylformylglycinamidine synthase [Caldicellulosiruptor bescii]PBD03678.1 phosphoribosylformylglycinamidine synthase [Caldicellulosiruptor bescii]PBD06688.1 phosphoribosylformylglycinamidine synthase [Caldicellul
MNKHLYEEVGLTYDEYKMIVEILGREPNELELNLFGVMWSEHCGYKNSKAFLKNLPTKGEHILQGPGENAGIVDIGDGYAVCFKVESHNHPSAVEPYEGAATGVGGIIRDIFTMGARPIALLDSLKFGSLSDSRTKYLFEGVVAGIAGYGNCVGIPTVGGETTFDPVYKNNILVNVMCVGIMKKDKIFKGIAQGVGNSVFYVGHTTGRDGMGGATFASTDLTAESEEKRSAVQVGDPFMEKLLLEACLELFQTDAVVGIQDMGAAGLTSSTCETAARAGTGIEIDVALVPKREEGMNPIEVMLSESQERMLVIVKKEKEEEVYKIFEKWGLHAVKIGKVTDDGMLRVLENGKVIAEVPAKALAHAPAYVREVKEPAIIKEAENFDIYSIPQPNDLNEAICKMISNPNLASKEYIYRQYDHMVRTDTVIRPGHDASLLRIKGTKKGIAVTIDSNGRYCYLNPYEGVQLVLAESYRNIVAVGAKPLAITDGLNFGNPHYPEIYYQFVKTIEGMKVACEHFETPVTGGNVSFYNQSEEGAIYPTPVIGMIGIIDDIEKAVDISFKNEGDLIAVVGKTSDDIGASEYLSFYHRIVSGRVPKLDLKLHKRVCDKVLECIKEGLFNSVHDISDGGFAIALIESAIKGSKGAELQIKTKLREDFYLFSETPGRFVVTFKEENLRKIHDILDDIEFTVVGRVTDEYIINGKINDKDIHLDLKEIERIYQEAIPCALKS